MCARPPLSAAYFDPAYINVLASATPDKLIAEQLCRIYAGASQQKHAGDDLSHLFTQQPKEAA